METIYEIAAKITADSSELTKALNQTDKAVNKTGKSLDKETKDWKKSFSDLGKTFAVAGAAITVAMGGIIKSFVGAGSELHDMSLMTGLSVKALAGLKYAAEQNSASIGNVQVAIRTLANTMNDASDGMETATRLFTKLNLNVQDLKSLSPDDLFMKVASAIAEVPDPMQRSALAVDMFGRSGTQLLPMLSEGAEGLKKMTEEGVKLSGWTSESAGQADALGDSFTTLKAAISGTVNTIASSFAPVIQNLVSRITNIVSEITKWAKEHPELTKALSLTVSGIGGFLTIGGTLLLILPKIATGIMALRTAFIAAQASMGPVGLAFAAISLALTILVPILMSLDDETDSASEAMDEFKSSVSDTSTPLKTLGKNINDIPELKAIVDANKQKNDIQKVTDETKELEWVTKALSKASENQAKVAQKAHTQAMKMLNEEYDKQLKLLDLKENSEVKALQDQIDALNNQTDEEEKALEDQSYLNEKANLEKSRNNAETLEEWNSYDKQLKDLEANYTRTLVMRERDDKIKALQVEIEKVKDSYKTKREQAETWYKTQKELLDTALEEELARIEEVTAKLEEAYGIREKDTEAHISKLQEIINKLKGATVFIDVITRALGQGTSSETPPSDGVYRNPTDPEHGVFVPPGGYAIPFAQGGIVNQPTLAMVGEGGEREAIIPEHDWGSMGGANITFSQPVFFEREDQMYKFARIINKYIQSGNRQNFGNAYAGA